MVSEELNYKNARELNAQKSETYAVIDGLNGAFSRNDGVARLSDLVAIGKRISNDYGKFEIIVDASARHKIDNKFEFDRLIKKGKIVLCPAGIEGDDLIWVRARSLVAKGYLVSIISNDMFPVRRAEDENILIASVVVSIFHDGEIYFLTRRMKGISLPPSPYMGSKIELVEVEG